MQAMSEDKKQREDEAKQYGVSMPACRAYPSEEDLRQTEEVSFEGA